MIKLTVVSLRGKWIQPVAMAIAVLAGSSSIQADAPNAKLYMVVNLWSVPTTNNFPITFMPAVPSRGWTDEYKTTKMAFRRIPAGTFLMGSPPGEYGRHRDEIQHPVTLSRPFYISIFEVTHKQAERVMGKWIAPPTTDPKFACRPVEVLDVAIIRGAKEGALWPASSAVDPDSFMGRLRARTGKPFDLPTEAQWEYAARGGVSSVPYWHVMLEHSRTDGFKYRDNAVTEVVGCFEPNAWGLYDMTGNAYEFCLDWYGPYPGRVTDPTGPPSGAFRVSRGGGSWSPRAICRVAERIADGRRGETGFRIVLLEEQ